jgi:hypothetical protein
MRRHQLENLSDGQTGSPHDHPRAKPAPRLRSSGPHFLLFLSRRSARKDRTAKTEEIKTEYIDRIKNGRILNKHYAESNLYAVHCKSCSRGGLFLHARCFPARKESLCAIFAEIGEQECRLCQNFGHSITAWKMGPALFLTEEMDKIQIFGERKVESGDVRSGK